MIQVIVLMVIVQILELFFNTIRHIRMANSAISSTLFFELLSINGLFVLRINKQKC